MNVDTVLANAIVGPSSGASAIPSRANQETASASVSHPSSPLPEKLPGSRQFEVDVAFAANNRIIYRIVDKDTQDLIQQIPPEQVLAIARGIQELL